MDARNRDADETWNEARLLAYLTEQGVPFDLHRHPPLHTVEESQALRGEMHGAHVKNMFLKGKKGELWLVTCLEERKIHIRDLEKQLGARKMSFGAPELLWETLGVRPGSVTPVAVLNDERENRVGIALDQAILDAERVYFHPLHNEATVGVSPSDLLNILETAGHPPLKLDFEALEEQARARKAE